MLGWRGFDFIRSTRQNRPARIFVANGIGL